LEKKKRIERTNPSQQIQGKREYVEEKGRRVALTKSGENVRYETLGERGLDDFVMRKKGKTGCDFLGERKAFKDGREKGSRIEKEEIGFLWQGER